MANRSAIPARNHRLTPMERQGLLAQIERDNRLMEFLKEGLTSRLKIQTEAAASLDLARTTLSEAQSRLKVSETQHSHIANSLKILRGGFDQPIHGDVIQTASVSPHITATGRILKRQRDLISVVENSHTEAEKEVRDALEAVEISTEDLQCAATLHKVSGNLIPDIERQLGEISQTITRQRESLRAIWQVPTEVWQEIFSCVFTSAKDTQEMQPYTIYSIIFSSVCYHWQQISRSQNALWPPSNPKTWNAINTVAIPSFDSQKPILFYSIYHLFSGLQILELHGTTLDSVLPQLMTKIAWNYDPLPPSCDVKLKSLNRLVVSNYEGNGDIIFRWAEDRQATLLGIENNNDLDCQALSTTIEPGINSTPSVACKFVEYCYRRLGLGKPDVTSPTLKIVNSWIPSLVLTLFIARRTISVATGSRETIKDALYFAVSRYFKQYDPTLWIEFQQRGTVPEASPKSFFKVELRNCGHIDPTVLQKLTPYC